VESIRGQPITVGAERAHAGVRWGPTGMTHDRAIERAFLAQHLLVLLAAMLVAAAAHRWLSLFVPLRAPPPAHLFLPILALFIPAWALVADRVALPRLRTISGSPVARVRALVLTQLGGAAAGSLLLTIAQVGFNRSMMLVFFVTSSVLLGMAMQLQRKWLWRHHHEAQNLLVAPERGPIADELETLRGRRLDLLPVADPDRLRARLRAGAVDEVVTRPGLPADEVRSIVLASYEAGIPVLVPLEPVDVSLPPPRAEIIGDRLYLVYQRRDVARASLLVKAAIDRVAAAMGLILLLPLFVAVAIAIKLTSRGPVLFVQERGGLNGRRFRMLKFRTMRVGAEAERDGLLAKNEMDGPVFKLREDPRVTAMGRFLRATSIDELPQLANVLAGHMSLVGPRPLPLVETRELVGAQRRRLSMRPGITCLWQISGRNDLTFRRWMELDLQYIDEWSLILDLTILLRTVPALLTRRGAR
jgi:exopolysaccharide biosynthesis polyprenyl glycosylphosphotransferase